MTSEESRSATIVAPHMGGSERAQVRWSRDTTRIHDGFGAETVLRNGVDVDTLALRRTPNKHGSTVWTLDLMQGEESRARFHSPPWDFDREHGPAQGSEISGLPLVQRNPKLANPPKATSPRRASRIGEVLAVAALLSPLASVVCILVPRLRDNPWVWVGVVACSLPYLVFARWPRRRNGNVVFRPRPAGLVSRGFLKKGAITASDGLLYVRTAVQTFALPGPADVCGPRGLRPASDSSTGELLVLVADSGHVLATFPRIQWCSDGSEAELAEAVGAKWDPTPVDASSGGGVATGWGPSLRSNRPVIPASLPSLFAVMALMGPASGSGAPVAVAVGAVGILLGIVGTVVEILLHTRQSKQVNAKEVEHRDRRG